jgi:hypothetical protein
MKKLQNARQIVENGVDQVDLVAVGTSGNEKEKKRKKTIFSLFFACDMPIFAPFSLFAPPNFFSFSLFRFRKCQLQPDQPGLRRFRQFVVRFGYKFCRFCINFRAFLTIFWRFYHKSPISFNEIQL